MTATWKIKNIHVEISDSPRGYSRKEGNQRLEVRGQRLEGRGDTLYIVTSSMPRLSLSVAPDRAIMRLLTFATVSFVVFQEAHSLSLRRFFSAFRDSPLADMSVFLQKRAFVVSRWVRLLLSGHPRRDTGCALHSGEQGRCGICTLFRTFAPRSG